MHPIRRIAAAMVAAAALVVPSVALSASPAGAAPSDELATSGPALAEDYTEGGSPQSLVFYRGAYGEVLYRAFVHNAWGSAFSLGGQIVGTPGAVGVWWNASQRRTELVARGTDNAVWTRERVNFGGWDPWRKVGGQITAPPAVAGGSRVVDYYARGTDGAVWTRRYSASTGWTGWASVGGRVLPGTGPAVSQEGSHRTVWVTGLNHSVWAKVFNGSKWGPWVDVGAPEVGTSDTPAVTQTGNSTRLFVRGQDNRLYYVANWTSLGGVLTSAPGATALTEFTGTLVGVDVAVRGTDNALWARSLRGNTWTSWKRW